MLVFILDASDPADVRATAASLEELAGEWRPMYIRDHYAATMNRALAAYEQPFFVVLFAGDALLPELAAELPDICSRLPEDCAGIVFREPDAREGAPPLLRPAAPAVWRTAAVAGGEQPGFPGRERLPFEQYALHDKMYRLSGEWRWRDQPDPRWLPCRRRARRWDRDAETWQLIHPIIRGEDGSAPSPGRPAVSIVVCCYNDAGYLPWAVRSVRAQTDSSWELLVIDDGSNDEPESKLRPFADDPRIRLIRFEANRGKAFRLNQALALAQGEWLLELDADDWLAPDCVASLLAAARREAEPPAVVYADSCEWSETTAGTLRYQGVRRAPNPFRPERLLTEAFPVAPRMYRTDALRSIGGWLTDDPFDGRLYEDFQILLRMSRRFPLRHEAGPLYHVRIRPSSVIHRHAGQYARWRRWAEELFP